MCIRDRPYAPSLVLTPGPGWVLDKDGRITVRGERGVLTDQYDVTASSTLDLSLIHILRVQRIY